MINRKYHTVRTVHKSVETENTTLSEQFTNLIKQKIPHCQNSSQICRNRKYYTVRTVHKSYKTENTTLSEQFTNL